MVDTDSVGTGIQNGLKNRCSFEIEGSTPFCPTGDNNVDYIKVFLRRFNSEMGL